LQEVAGHRAKGPRRPPGRREDTGHHCPLVHISPAAPLGHDAHPLPPVQEARLAGGPIRKNFPRVLPVARGNKPWCLPAASPVFKLGSSHQNSPGCCANRHPNFHASWCQCELAWGFSKQGWQPRGRPWTISGNVRIP
jgi:hypothetical protein